MAGRVWPFFQLARTMAERVVWMGQAVRQMGWSLLITKEEWSAAAAAR
jgi:hypothetical protein